MSLAEVVALVNGILALFSFVAIQWSMPKVGRPLKLILGVASAFALFYSGAYFWLFLHPEQVLGWGNIMRFISWFVWPIAWAAPAVASAMYVRRSTALVKDLTQSLTERIEESKIEYH